MIEVGPHPALKGPTSQINEEIIGEKIPYSSCLSRGKNSVGAMAERLGKVWVNLGSGVVDFNGYELYLSGLTRP